MVPGPRSGNPPDQGTKPAAGAGSNPSDFAAFDGALYFSANDGVNGSEFWKTDGTAPGTVLVRDINATAAGADAFPYGFTVLNGSLTFAADDGVNGFELWKSDGTAANTDLLKDICPGACSSM